MPDPQLLQPRDTTKMRAQIYNRARKILSNFQWDCALVSAVQFQLISMKSRSKQNGQVGLLDKFKICLVFRAPMELGGAQTVSVLVNVVAKESNLKGTSYSTSEHRCLKFGRFIALFSLDHVSKFHICYCKNKKNASHYIFPRQVNGMLTVQFRPRTQIKLNGAKTTSD